MNGEMNTRRLWQTLLCLMLAAVLTLMGAAAEADLDASVIDAPQGESASDLDLELVTVSDEEIVLESDLIEEELVLDGDLLEALTETAPGTVSDPVVSENDANGALNEHTGKDNASDGTINYALFAPAEILDSMPLIIYLHGSHERGEDISDATKNGFPRFLLNGELGTVPAWVLVPQLPEKAKQWKDYDSQVMKLIKYICSTYSIDRSKISMTGHSMGGMGCWSFAIKHPGVFSCIAPISGGLFAQERELQILSEIPIQAYAGDQDINQLFGANNTKNMKRLGEINPNFSYTIIQNADHAQVSKKVYTANKIEYTLADGRILKLPEIITWLISNESKGKQAPSKPSIDKASVTGITEKTWTGKSLTQTLAVKVSGKSLKSDTDYMVFYKNNINVGKATVTIIGKGSYTGTITKTFKVIPKAVEFTAMRADARQLSLKWNEGTGGVSYELQYSLKKDFSKKETVTIDKTGTVECVIKNLTPGKTYYFRVRAFKEVDGKRYESAWSKSLSRKLK